MRGLFFYLVLCVDPAAPGKEFCFRMGEFLLAVFVEFGWIHHIFFVRWLRAGFFTGSGVRVVGGRFFKLATFVAMAHSTCIDKGCF